MDNTPQVTTLNIKTSASSPRVTMLRIPRRNIPPILYSAPLLDGACLTTKFWQGKVKVVLRAMVSHPVWFGVRHPSGLKTKFLLPSDICGFFYVMRFLWRVCVDSYSWASPAKSLSGPSLARFIIIFYCLRFDSCRIDYNLSSNDFGWWKRNLKLAEKQFLKP
jgi:hypothetical protein